SLIRRWRENNITIPIMVLTARESWQEKVTELNAGADDYVTKPFHFEEIVARVQALMRRNIGISSQILTIDPFDLDLSRK
ncbi:response regulator, partial [Proteus mirabilis]|uniref:response regulator n=1 Tax=Proteus mirabilis TaxID=584 RepID=UPI002576AE40